MQIWRRLIELFKPDKKAIRPSFGHLENAEYSSAEEYLGASGEVKIHPENIVFRMTYTVRDGFWVQIKRIRPWKIMFEYMDSGAYLVNDANDMGYDGLVEALDQLNQRTKNCHHLDVYNSLEAIMYAYVLKYYRGQP